MQKKFLKESQKILKKREKRKKVRNSRYFIYFPFYNIDQI